MIPQERILILSGELGEGHKQAAHALLEASVLYRPQAEVQVVDFMKILTPRLHNLGKFLFLQGVKTFPSVYGYLYQKTRKPNSLTQLLKLFKIFGISRLVNMLNTYQPTVVVSTFPVAAAAMSLLKISGMTQVPTVTIITDHTDHSYWIHEGTNHYIVGSEGVRNKLHQLHIPTDCISVTGIPLRSNFCHAYSREALLHKHHLDPLLPTVMLMGGGYGMIDRGLIDLLAGTAISRRLQIVIVCGHNRKLLANLEELLTDSPHHITLTGYIQHVHEFMACSDLIITKPGGLTTSEALAMHLPMLLYRPLPGQEQDNAAFLLEAGVALEANNEVDLRYHLEDLLHHPEQLQCMKERTAQFPMHDASRQALDAIVQTQVAHTSPAWQRTSVHA